MGIRWRILIFIKLLKKGYAMTENNILQFKNPSEVESGLEKILQEGAIKMLKQAVEAEIDAFLSAHKSRHTEDGYSQIVRNGYLPERTIQTGLGHIPVQVLLPGITGVFPQRL